jgi:predicted short-subunit dehydrogenase-like oxidoreductase (DUF2520 family)
MKIAMVGAGRLATSLAAALKRAGYTITEIVSRANPSSLRKARNLAHNVGAHAASFDQAKLDASLIWFCVPDGEIGESSRYLAPAANWKNKQAFHSSGALASDELAVLRKRGAAVASVHPLMTFVGGSRPSLKGVPVALEGDRAAITLARKIVQRLGGKSFPIRQQDKALYHAWGTFASPLLIALLATAEQVAQASGIPIKSVHKKMLPILRQTLNNYATLGPAKAFSGPLVRGDADILARHLAALKKIPHAAEVYQALARSALQYLPAQNKEKSGVILKS